MKAWLWVSIAATVVVLIGSLEVWGNREQWLPDEVPTHWNASNVPDKFTPRDEMLVPLMMMPAMMAMMTALALALPFLSPVKFTIEPFRPTYDYIMMLVILMFAYMSTVIAAAYMGHLTDVGGWIIGGVLVLIAAMGNVLGKVKRNFYVGIRTPWTLASDQVWDRTHRVGAWLFVAAGVGGLALLLLGMPALWSLSVLAVAVVVPIGYSLWLYKRLEREGRLGEQR